MQITVNKENDLCTIGLSGRLDTVTAPELETAVTQNLPGTKAMVLDLAGLEYTSSAGLRVFLKTQKLMKAQGSLKLVNVCADILEIFEMTGFTDILTIE